MKEVALLGIQMEANTGAPVLVLGEHEGRHRILPLFVGAPEATAIALALAGAEPPRPLTHDLLLSLVETLGATVERVEVTRMVEGAFVADLVLQAPTGVLRVDARPSDAIAVAVRAGAPLFVADAVLDEAATELPDRSPDSEPQLERGIDLDDHAIDSEVDAFREFLTGLDPDDFRDGPESPPVSVAATPDLDLALIHELCEPDDPDDDTDSHPHER